MTRALHNAWIVFHHCWTHRRAWRIVVEATAEYPLNENSALDWEWRLLQEGVRNRADADE